MTISKDTFDAYRIVNNFEWATIAIKTWSRQANYGKDTYYCGEIMIHSSFGNFNNSWTACGVPFKQFLLDVDWHYFMEKCGCTTHVYDGKATLLHIQRDILRWRLAGDLDKKIAFDLWNEIGHREIEIMSSLNEMVNALQVIETEISPSRAARDFLSEPWDYAIQKPNPQAVGFWNELWPEFVAELRREIANEVAP